MKKESKKMPWPRRGNEHEEVRGEASSSYTIWGDIATKATKHLWNWESSIAFFRTRMPKPMD